MTQVLVLQKGGPNSARELKCKNSFGLFLFLPVFICDITFTYYGIYMLSTNTSDYLANSCNEDKPLFDALLYFSATV